MPFKFDSPNFRLIFVEMLLSWAWWVIFMVNTRPNSNYAQGLELFPFPYNDILGQEYGRFQIIADGWLYEPSIIWKP